jgi:hypothetical protein
MRPGDPQFQSYRQPPTFPAPPRPTQPPFTRPAKAEATKADSENPESCHEGARRDHSHLRTDTTSTALNRRTRAKGPFVHPGDPRFQAYRGAPTFPAAKDRCSHKADNEPERTALSCTGGPPIFTLPEATDRIGRSRVGKDRHVDKRPRCGQPLFAGPEVSVPCRRRTLLCRRNCAGAPSPPMGGTVLAADNTALERVEVTAGRRRAGRCLVRVAP